MVTLVLIIGALNLGLGFVLALGLEQVPDSSPRGLLAWSRVQLAPVRYRLRQWRGWHWPRRRQSGPETAAVAADAAPALATPEQTANASAAATTPAPAAVPAVEALPDYRDLPDAWRVRLREQQVVTQSRWESALWMLSDGLRSIQERALALDSEVRPAASWESRCPDLARTTEEPVPLLEDVLAALGPEVAVGGWQAAVESFREWVEQELLAWKELRSRFLPDAATSAPPDAPSPTDAWAAVLARLTRMLEWCHDRHSEVRHAEKRLERTSLERLLGTLPRFHRVAADAVVAEWLERDPERLRMVSIALFDIDRYGEFLEGRGAEAAQKLAEAIVRLTKDLVRKDRGFDRVAWIAETTVFVLMGDTALRNATTGTERIRQSLANATFKLDEDAIQVTASAAVTEWLPTESCFQLLARLRRGLDEARGQGGNATAVCGDEVRLAQSNKLALPAREVTL